MTGEKNQRTFGYSQFSSRSGSNPLKRMQSMLLTPAQNIFALPLVAALAELTALAGHVGDHQTAAVQHPQELLQLFQRDLLRRKLGLESLLDLVEAGRPVEHLQDGEFLFLEAVVASPIGSFTTQ